MLEHVCRSVCGGPHIREEIECLLPEVAARVECGCVVVALVRPQTANLPRRRRKRAVKMLCLGRLKRYALK